MKMKYLFPFFINILASGISFLKNVITFITVFLLILFLVYSCITYNIFLGRFDLINHIHHLCLLQLIRVFRVITDILTLKQKPGL
jgi:AAA+ ATPase superfamily predicted ATPase